MKNVQKKEYIDMFSLMRDVYDGFHEVVYMIGDTIKEKLRKRFPKKSSLESETS